MLEGIVPGAILGLLSTVTAADDGDVMTSVGERKHAHDDESDEPAPQARVAAAAAAPVGRRNAYARRALRS